MAKLRQSDPKYHRSLMVDHGYAEEIVMIKYGLTRRSAKRLIKREGIDRLIESGALDRIPQPTK